MLNEFLSDLKQIEKALRICHGPFGSCALIQSSLTSNNCVNFTLTNYSFTLVNSLMFNEPPNQSRLTSKQFLTFIQKIVQTHSRIYGDGCKTLFFYILNGLSLNVILSCTSKLNQAFLNFRNSSTGALSAITLLFQFLGGVVRIFTSIQETGDFNLIMTYTITSFANVLLVFQLFYYWNTTIQSFNSSRR